MGFQVSGEPEFESASGCCDLLLNILIFFTALVPWGGVVYVCVCVCVCH